MSWDLKRGRGEGINWDMESEAGGWWRDEVGWGSIGVEGAIAWAAHHGRTKELTNGRRK